MHCPVCGQKQVAENTRFCSRCGFLLTGVIEVMANNGLLPNQNDQTQIEFKDSPRKRGIKQGAMIMLVGMLLIVPIIAMIHVATDTEPIVMAIAGIISFWGGILRMIYAWMFESKFPGGKTLEQNIIANTQNFIGGKPSQQSLPPSQSIPVNNYVAPNAGSWRETNDLVEVGSVTDNTTKLLEKDS